MDFDMNRTWSQAIALVRANFQLLAVIAGVFVLLPALAVYAAMPQVISLFDVNADPETLDAQMTAALPKLAIYGLVAFLFEMVGYMAMIALVGGGRPTVGESIMKGVKAIPTVVGASIVLMLGFFMVAFVIALIAGVIAGLAAASGSAAGAGLISVVTSLGMLAAMAYLFARLAPLLPVIVLEGEYNPLKAIGRAWRLTKPRAWAILGFFALLFVAYLVISMVLMTLLSAFGLAAGGASVFVTGVFAGLLGAAVTMLMSAILVSIHQQLSGPSPERLSETFE